MSLLITTNSAVNGDGLLHLTRTYTPDTELNSEAPLSNTILHTGSSNTIEVIATKEYSTAGGVDSTVVPAHLTGSFCKHFISIPGLVGQNYIPGGRVWKLDVLDAVTHESVLVATPTVAFVCVYDPISGYACNGIGNTIVHTDFSNHANTIVLFNARSCCLAILGGAEFTTAAVGFNLDDAYASAMYTNRASLKVFIYYTNLNVSLTDGTISTPPIYASNDIVMTDRDITVNGVSLFKRKYVTPINANYYMEYTRQMNPVAFAQAMKHPNSYSIANGRDTDRSYSMSSVKVTGNSIILNEGVNNSPISAYSGTTALNYSSIVYLNTGESYTLPTATSKAFVVLVDSAGIASPFMQGVLAGASSYDNVYLFGLYPTHYYQRVLIWLSRVDLTFTLNGTNYSYGSNVTTIRNDRCAILVYTP